MSTEKVRRDDHCFCCGAKNERGLKLSYSYPETGKAETSFLIPEYFSGWESMTHGGFISMLLDETMAHSCVSRGLQGVTAELTVRFKNPLPVGTRIILEGHSEDPKTRIVKTGATLRDDAGTLYAMGSAKFLVSGATQKEAPPRQAAQ